MISLENYLYDGAGWQARAVMTYLQSRGESILEKLYTGDPWFPYNGGLFLEHYNYGREKGYVFSVRYKHLHQVNYAVYEHCVSDEICVVKSNAFTDHPDGWDGKEWSKYEHDKNFAYGEAVKCGEWIEDDMRAEIAKWLKEEKEDEEERRYAEEKESLLNEIRNLISVHGPYEFNDGSKVFYPTYFGEKRKEAIIDVYIDDGEIIIGTEGLDESGDCYEDYNNCSHFSNDEIREIIKLLN